MEATWDWAPGVDGSQYGVDGAQDGVDGRHGGHESLSARLAPWRARSGSPEVGFVGFVPLLNAHLSSPSGVLSNVIEPST